MNVDRKIEAADREMVSRLHVMSEFLKICSMPGHLVNIYISAIHDAKPSDEADTAPVVVSDAELQALPQRRMVSFTCSGEKNVEHREPLWFGRVELFFAVPSRALPAVAYSTWICRC